MPELKLEVGDLKSEGHGVASHSDFKFQISDFKTCAKAVQAARTTMGQNSAAMHRLFEPAWRTWKNRGFTHALYYFSTQTFPRPLSNFQSVRYAFYPLCTNLISTTTNYIKEYI